MFPAELFSSDRLKGQLSNVVEISISIPKFCPILQMSRTVTELSVDISYSVCPQRVKIVLFYKKKIKHIKVFLVFSSYATVFWKYRMKFSNILQISWYLWTGMYDKTEPKCLMITKPIILLRATTSFPLIRHSSLLFRAIKRPYEPCYFKGNTGRGINALRNHCSRDSRNFHRGPLLGWEATVPKDQSGSEE